MYSSSQVITSSFAAIIDSVKGNRPGYVYSEKDWNTITEEEALENPSRGYFASKTFAEKAAWDFVEKEKPNFTLVTVNTHPNPFYPVFPRLTRYSLLGQPPNGVRSHSPPYLQSVRCQHFQPTYPRHYPRQKQDRPPPYRSVLLD